MTAHATDVRESIEIVDGFVIDTNTGEILGHQDTSDQFCVTDQKSAEWVLGKMQEEDAAVLALETRRQAINEQIDAMIRDHKRRRDWLEYRFGSQLKDFCERAIAGLKARSLKLIFGTIGFRLNPGSIKVRDEAKEWAVDWAEINAPEAVKVTKSLLVTPLKGREGELPGDVFDVIAPHDAFYIKTGVKA